MTEQVLPPRGLKIVAESFAIQALALEKIHLASGKAIENDQRLIKSLEMAGDIALHYFQEQDKLHGLVF